MFKLISILDRLLFLLNKWAVQREQKKAQKDSDELHKNPSHWFDTHFNGMPTVADKSEQTNKTNITNTKTD
jgi:hypothetical protein